MSKKRFTSKTYLKVLIVVGLLAVVGGGAGTFASFNATTTNSGNTFATGTLVLQNHVAAGTCLSTGAGTNTDTNANTGCDAAFNVNVQKPGDIATGQVTLQNKGNLAATVLTLTKSSCGDSDASGTTYHGSGSVCGALNFYVQEWSDNFVTPSKCWYGGGTATTCDPTFATSPATLAGFGASPVDISAGPHATAFTANGGTADTRWFTIGVELPNTNTAADNTLQGRQALLSLAWEESQ